MISRRPLTASSPPYTRFSYPAIQPSIQAFDVILHVRYPVIVYILDIDFYLFHCLDDTSASAPGSRLAQFILGFLP